MVATAIALRSKAPWSPLRCDGTTLPPAWLLTAKLLAFALFPGRLFLGASRPFLPFLPILDAPFFEVWLAPSTAAMFYLAFTCLMFNRVVQPACGAIAACLFLHVAGHRLDYANNLMFVGVFLLLVACYGARTGTWPLRIQLALVYLGAGVDKALDPDWWNGHFFDTLMIDALHVRWYEAAAHVWPPHMLGSVLGALTIGAEAAIAIAVMWRSGRAGVLLMLSFHATMLVCTRGQLSTLFLYATIAVMPPFVESGRDCAGPPQWRRLAWWAVALSIRELPRLLGHA